MTNASKQPTPWWIVATALFGSVGPLVIHTAILALSRSLSIVLGVAGLLIALFVAAGLWLYAYTAGSLRAVETGSIVGLVLAVVTYNALAIPLAYIAVAVFFPAGAQ